MPSDYAHAAWTPSPNFWAGYDARDFIVVHATASGNNATEIVPTFDAATGKSVHYAIAKDGHVVQYVSEANSAWGNCCVDGNSTFRADYNWNKSTISIENEKHSDDNSTPLTTAQYQSLLLLIRDIAARWNIPLVHGQQGVRGIIFHHDLMPIEKARCPGNFPYDTFFQDLGTAPHGGTVKLNAQGCVCDVVRSNQLFENEMELCGPWSARAIFLAGAPGSGPKGTAEDIDSWVDAYVSHEGFTPANFPGVSIPDEENILKALGDHWQEIPSDVGSIRKAVQAGYPVLFTANEANIFWWTGSGWGDPYGWKISANHVLPVTGIDNRGNFICPDQLSSRSPWPVIYDATRLNPSYAVIMQLPFLQPIPSGNPNTWPLGFNAQSGGSLMPVPTNWKDSNNILTAPNGFTVQHGFRDKILAASSWPSANQPTSNEEQLAILEESNPARGAGARQIFLFGDMFEYSPKLGVTTGWLGQEFAFVKADRDAKATALAAAHTQIATLQAQLATQSPPPTPPANLADVKAQLTTAAESIAKAIATLFT